MITIFMIYQVQNETVVAAGGAVAIVIVVIVVCVALAVKCIPGLPVFTEYQLYYICLIYWHNSVIVCRSFLWSVPQTLAGRSLYAEE